ncbi:MAG: DNA repair protein RadC [Chitinophagales bacterium]|nr:DNA repair protein RadC [Bacteroidota bacterium]MCB9042301.1 DNA repair protein RadC [Chitinophagales bacterium]
MRKLDIKSWAKEDRPREKLMLQGRQNLSLAELIAILIGSGNDEESAVDLSKRILNHANNNLTELARLSINDLCKFKGIGEAKAITIAAALELGRRRQHSEAINRSQITNSKDVVAIFQPLLADLPHEEFWILLLNRANKVISTERISIGGISGTIADSRVIFKRAIEALASSIILAHNHPSGNAQPSEADKTLTKNMHQSGKILDLPVLDHIIIAGDRFFSFADAGILAP